MMAAKQVPNLLIVGLSIAGMAVAIYLTSVHYASVPLECSSSGVINCAQVLHSSYAEVLGIPWSLGGIIWFFISGALALIGLLQSPEPPFLHPAQTAWTLMGLGVVFYLVGVELVAVKHICAWCSSMHVMIVLTLLLVLFRQPDLDEEAYGDT